DTVRIAASDPDLWTEILAANATAVADVLDRFAAEVHQVVGDLRGMIADSETDKSISREGDFGEEHLAGLRTALERGRAGYRRIPGKHGAPAVAYTVIPVVIPDEPGALARLFGSAGEAGINIEDIAIEHSPGQPVGLVELSVAPAAAQPLTKALQALGWSVH
ncbi:MAG: prephenate dehydrogenase dimerization domain-containing protein, partial [Candidatus Nanopelagicales bacterium]